MEYSDENVGSAVATYRALEGLSQSDLAKRLQERGIPLAQQTVAKIEAGTRPLKLTEAAEIAEALRVTVPDLLHPGDVVAAREMLLHTADAVRTYKEELSAAVWKYEHARVSAAAVVARGRLMPDPRYRSEVEELRRLLQLKAFDYENERMYHILATLQTLPADERAAAAELLGVSLGGDDSDADT